MNSQGYFKQAQEYRESADSIAKTIKKYEEQLKRQKSNREHLNSVIMSYRIMADNALRVAKILEDKGRKIAEEEKLHT
jgi:hypothetical protein